MAKSPTVTRKPVSAEVESPRVFSTEQICEMIEQIETNVVMGGAPMSITWAPATNPMDIGPMIKQLDPAADIVAAFKRGAWTGREIKTALIHTIHVRNVGDKYSFVDFLSDGPSIEVPPRLKEKLLGQLKSAGILKGKRLDTLDALLSGSGAGALSLTQDERFECEYSTNDESKSTCERILRAAGA
jgi:hypothetical protein